MEKCERTNLRKSTIGLLLLFMIFLCWQPLSVYGQDLGRRFDYSCTNEPMPNVLKKLEKLSKFKILFVYNDIQTYRVSVNLRSKTIEEVVRAVLGSYPLTYKIKEEYITISSKKDKQRQRLIGTVRDMHGTPLPGVIITTNDKTIGGQTDINGNFEIPIPVGREVLTVAFSYLGMKKVERKYSMGMMLVTMEDDTHNVDEVVVTGIFERKAESFTGAAVTVTSKELKRVGNQNVLQSLKNLDPTIYIPDNLSLGSDPNSVPSVSMRGTSSFPVETSSLKSRYQHQPNAPLFILDGFETTAEHVMDLDMNRVESVTILKDASAKALYGSKAANGVIVIETKRLAGTETRITYNGSLDMSVPDLSSYNMTNAMEKLQVEQYEGIYTAGSRYNNNWVSTEQNLRQLYNSRYKRVLEGLSTDWLSKPLRTGVGHKHNVNVELGDARNLRAILNFTYNDIKGVMRGSKRRNLSGDVSVSYRNKNLLFKNILYVVSNNSMDSPYGLFSDYVRMNPYWQAVDERGNVLRWAEKMVQTASNSSLSVANPMYDATIGTMLKSTYSEFTDNFYTEWTINPDWKATVRLGAEQKRNDADSYYPARHSKFASYRNEDRKRRGQYILENGKQTQLSGDININYNHTFGLHHVFGNGGYFVSETKYQAYQHVAEGFANENAADATFARQYAEGSTPTGYATINREMSFLLALSYDFDNRYLMDASVRESASSLYGADKRWANSWSFGLGWNVHNESFMKEAKWLKMLKIRGSLGLTGNQNFNTNASIATYRYFPGIIYEGQMGAYLSNMPNPKLMWEQKKDYNVGFDMRASIFSLSFDWYSSDTKNMLTNVTIPTSTGFGVVKDNLGLVRNSGVEIKGSVTPVQNNNGFLSVYGAFVYTKNKIINLSESMRTYNERMLALAEKNTQSAPVLMYQDGLSMNTIWAVRSAGIDPQSGRELYIKKDGSYTYVYDSSDMVAAGDATPKYRGNAGFTAEYKGVGLTATFTYLAGGQLYNRTLVDRVEDADIRYNVDRRVLDGRWQKPGQITQYKKYSSETVTRATTRFVQNRNELTLSSVSAYYEFPKSVYSKLRMQRLRVAAYLNDVVTLSSIKVERGTSYPFARNFSLSLSATF